METALYVAAFLLVVVGFTHSYLGERYILIRLFRRDNLPKLRGGTEFTTRTLRFAWHITSVAWWGFAAILVLLARGSATRSAVGLVIGVTFLLHFAMVILGSRAKHYAWLLFLAVGVLVLYATQR